MVTVPSDERGCVDMEALATVLDEDVAGIMLTNPNTLGLFEEDIAAIAAAVHEVGGLLYYDGANLNAILGVVRPGDMGFDIVHMNLHKTLPLPMVGEAPEPGRSPSPSDWSRSFPVHELCGSNRMTSHRSTSGRCHPGPSAGCTPGTGTRWSWPERWRTSWPTGEMACDRSPRPRSSTPIGSAPA